MRQGTRCSLGSCNVQFLVQTPGKATSHQPDFASGHKCLHAVRPLPLPRRCTAARPGGPSLRGRTCGAAARRPGCQLRCTGRRPGQPARPCPPLASRPGPQAPRRTPLHASPGHATSRASCGACHGGTSRASHPSHGVCRGGGDASRASCGASRPARRQRWPPGQRRQRHLCQDRRWQAANNQVGRSQESGMHIFVHRTSKIQKLSC